MAYNSANEFAHYVINVLSSAYIPPEFNIHCVNVLNGRLTEYMKGYPPLVILFGSLNMHMKPSEWTEQIRKAMNDDPEIKRIITEIAYVIKAFGQFKFYKINELLDTDII